MAVESVADRRGFLSDFGVVVTWTRSGTPTTLTGIFDRSSLLVEDASVVLIDRDASLLVLEADLPSGSAARDPVAIEGESQTYLCKAIRPRGDGFSVIDLKRA